MAHWFRILSVRFWRDMHERWTCDRADVQRKLDGLSSVKDEYIARGVQLVELTQYLESTYRKAGAASKRRLVKLVKSNRFLRNGTLEYDYEKPFNACRTDRKKKESGD